MDILNTHIRQLSALVLAALVLFIYVFFSPDYNHIPVIALIDHVLGLGAVFYLTHIGTNTIYAYFFIALLVYAICQWHLSHFIAHKALFIGLALALSIIIIQCSGVFFSGYTEHLQVISGTDTVRIIHNSFRSPPAAHVARLVTLTTCICMLISKRWIQLVLAILAALILVGMGVSFYDRFFLIGALGGVFVGFFVPYYLKVLLFTQHHTTRAELFLLSKKQPPVA